ncbi:COPI-coated vesicle protein [Apiospora phragmitis]|uniref:COPI-coated vesicle protein n=1 Tax=Apiospora phragmitis TaxID=2905665 RepID=A0ABR1T998_9PEZI
MDFSDSFRIVNLVVAAVMVLGGVVQFFPFGVSQNPNNSQPLIIGIYEIIFGAAVALLEFQIPPQVSRYASFMFSFIGRGVFYIFMGSILLSSDWFRGLAGSIVAFVGLAYCALEFIPSIEPPANMREADQGWGAEQV